MCGIVAVYLNSGRELNPDVLESMTERLHHRGPDDYGFGFAGPDNSFLWQDDPPARIGPSGVAMGHRRLSIIDLSADGRQPFVIRDKRYWMIYNGEIYNYIELREELSEMGCTFRTATDTEVLLTAYAHWGLDAFNKLNGMWALVIWDRERQTLVASRDRFGIKPLYYQQIDGDWLFASEVKALLQHPDAVRAPNEEAVYHYLKLGRAPRGGDTFFHTIHEVEPGSYLTIHRGKVAKNAYWELPQRPWLKLADETEAVETFASLFTDAVSLRLRSDVRVGTMLSGGLDSTSVISTLTELLATEAGARQAVGSSLQAFNASFPGQPIDETKGVDDLCRRLDLTAHKVYPMAENDVDQLFRDTVYHMEMPFINSVPMVNALLMRRARSEGITVVLNGHGADEIFAGYPYLYCAIAAADEIRRLNWARGIGEVAGMKYFQGMTWTSALSATFNSLVPDRLAARFRGKNSRSDALFRQGMLRKYPKYKTKYSMHRPPGKTALDQTLRLDFLHKILPYWLQMEDRISMSSSIESRLPFLDYRLVEFGFSLDNSLKINKGRTKYILRKSMQDRLPTSILSNPQKVRFPGPDSEWLRNGLCSLLQSSLIQSTPMIMQFVERHALRPLISGFIDRDGEDDELIWRLFNAEIWMRTFFA